MKRNIKKESSKTTRWIRAGECLYRWAENGMYYFRGQIRGRQFMKSLRTTDFETAKAELAKKRRALGYLDSKASDRTTLAELCASINPSINFDGKRVSDHTRDYRKRILDRINEDWPTDTTTTRLSKIRSSDCDRWLAKYDFGASTRNEYVSMLKGIFQVAIRDHLMIENPAAHLKWAKRKAPKRLTPSYDEFQAIIANIREQKFNGNGEGSKGLSAILTARVNASADFLEAMGRLGLGQAELAPMTRRDVDFRTGQVSVLRKKTGERFKIPIYPWARSLLERLCIGKRHHERLFEILDAKKALAAACERLDFPAYSQRSFRRMFITHCLEKGVDVKTVSQWQGHKTGTLILSTYSHVRPLHSQKMAELISDDNSSGDDSSNTTTTKVVPMKGGAA